MKPIEDLGTREAEEAEAGAQKTTKVFSDVLVLSGEYLSRAGVSAQKRTCHVPFFSTHVRVAVRAGGRTGARE